MANSTFRTIQTNFTEGVQFVKNYIKNSTFENNSTNGWSEFTTSMSGGLPTGTPTIGDVVNFTLATQLAVPISGSISMEVGSSGAWNAGTGVISDEFTIENEDLGKPLTFSLSYQAATNVTNFNWSGILGSQTLAIYIYDSTAGSWVQPSGFLGMNQISGVGQVMGNFQSTVVSGQKYRLAILALQNSAGTGSIYVDNVFIGKETSTVGSPITDYTDYTPTCNWTSGYTITGKYKIIGDSIECVVKLTCTGAPLAASETIFSIPPGYSIDTDKILTTTAGAAPTYGDAIGRDNSTTNLYLFRCQYWSTTTVKLFYQSSSTGQESAVTTAVPPSWAANDTIIAIFKVPIVGLSSSVQMSNATDTRVVAARYTTATGSTGGRIQFNTIDFDTHGAVTTGASWVYTAPVSGIYEVRSYVNVGANNIGTNPLSLTKNGSFHQNLSSFGASVANSEVDGSGLVSLNAGDTIYVSIGGASVTISSGWIAVNRLSGPSVIASTETISARYTNTSAQSIPNNSATNLTNWTKDFDTHNFIVGGTGVATINVSGKYTISGSLLFASGAFGSASQYSLLLNQTGSATREVVLGSLFTWSAGTNYVQINGSTTLNLLAGDTIRLRAFQFTGSAKTLDPNGNYSYFTITRVGN
jgi:hypothetical protein